MHVDHNFHIGEQHLQNGMPCQDYALSGMLEGNIAYAIVSDGCSSGGKTDIGARLTALATEQAIRECIRIPHFRSNEAYMAVNDRRNMLLEQFRMTLGLEPEDMLATCLWAIAWGNTVLTNVTGDGTVVVCHELETLTHSFQWSDNVPYYPAYKSTGEDEAFRARHANTPEPLTYIVQSNIPGMGDALDGSMSTYPADVGMKGLWVVPTNTAPDQFPGRLRSIALFSDGIGQIDGIPEESAVQELLAFKSTTGRFVTRRMNRFLKNVKQHGSGPIDDIACAVIAFDPPDQPEGEHHDAHNQTNEGDA
ncbi:MAG: protein phosphatase 2C domain-containing protein [Candidatus Paceibacterota bacterium]